jgi:hypothetical protein
MLIEVIIRKQGIAVSLPQDRKKIVFLDRDKPIPEQIEQLVADIKKTTSAIVFLVGEELLFFKSFLLPLRTPNIKEAVQYQLEQLIPFEESAVYYSYASTRENDAYQINLYVLQYKAIHTYIQQMADAGYNIAGLYPESQRYINKNLKKENWALVSPGRFSKVLSFAGSRLFDRHICYSEPDFSQLAEVSGTKKIYHLKRPIGSSFLDVVDLLGDKLAYKEFNMLPASFRRPDYYRKIILALLVLNVVALLSLISVKEYRLISLGNEVKHALEQVDPLVEEMKQLQKKEESYKAQIDRLTGLGKNPDFIKFFNDLTTKLPTSSYLDQMRLEKEGAIHIQGYTDDISELTSKLKSLGETKLKSTSRRRDKTYFQVEISLP